MGWEIRAEEDIIIPGIEQGLKDIEEGNIFYAKNADDMIQQILKWNTRQQNDTELRLILIDTGTHSDLF